MNVFKLQKSRNLLMKVMLLALVIVTTLCFVRVSAETITYPFRTGDDAFKNAPTWHGDTEKANADAFQFLQPNFTTVDLSDTTKDYYVALQIKLEGNPGFTFGLFSNGDRYGTYIDGNKLYKVTPTGEVTEISVLYNSINLGQNFEGMLVAPVSQLAWVVWASGSKSLATIGGVFIETNAMFNWGFKMTIGEIGVYEGDFRTNGTFTKVMDLTNGELKGSYYNARQAENPLVFASDTQDPIEGKTIAYPFRTGDLAYKNAVLWNGVKNTPNGDNWQTVKVNFEATDLTNATYIAVQYNAKAGTPGITYGLEHASARYSIVGAGDGHPIYMANEEGLVKLACKTLYGASNISSSGMLLIPMNSMNWQFGADADRNLALIDNLVFTTNSKYNFDYEIIFGEIGYYTGTLGEEDFTFHKLIDLTTGDKFGQFTCLSDNPDAVGRISINKIDQRVYGDTTIEVFGTNKQGSDYTIWDGGSFGKVEMGKDSYGDDAIVMTSTGANPQGDAYTAITLADGIAYNWSGKKGVTLWARNDSDTEISFNIQLDCLVDVDGDGKRDRGRFNIRQGYQFWLYDINSGLETIYMTRPEVTLPKGFEGWVRVPFDAFFQADWSLVDPAHKVIPRNYFMQEGSVVGYLAITIDSRAYTNKTFTINKLGSYETTPRLTTALIKDTSKTIKALMGLE